MCYTYDKSNGGDTRELQSRVVLPKNNWVEYAFKLAFLASLACVKTKLFSLKSEVKKAYLHAHKRILIMPSDPL